MQGHNDSRSPGVPQAATYGNPNNQSTDLWEKQKTRKLLDGRHDRYPPNEVGRVEKRAKSEFFGEGEIRPHKTYVSGGLQLSIGVALSEKS